MFRTSPDQIKNRIQNIKNKINQLDQEAGKYSLNNKDELNQYFKARQFLETELEKLQSILKQK